jgi:hypothetical protein
MLLFVSFTVLCQESLRLLSHVGFKLRLWRCCFFFWWQIRRLSFLFFGILDDLMIDDILFGFFTQSLLSLMHDLETLSLFRRYRKRNCRVQNKTRQEEDKDRYTKPRFTKYKGTNLHSIPRVLTTQMLRTLKPIHISSTDKVLRLLWIATANRPTPNRPTIMTIRLQDILLLLVIRIDSSPNITDRNSENTLPRRTL